MDSVGGSLRRRPMRKAVRIFARLGSLVILVLLALGIAIGAALWTDRGEDFLRRQTGHIASAFLGPAYSVEFGTQRIGLGPSGALGFAFSDVVLRDRETGLAIGTAGRVQLGIDLGSLVMGSLAADHLVIETVRLDPSIESYLGSGKALTPADVFASLDGPFVATDGAGLRGLEITDLAVLGHRSYRLDELEITAEPSGRSTFEAKGLVADRALTLSGMSVLDPSRRKLAELSVRTSEIELDTSATPAARGDGEPDFVLAASFDVSLRQTPAGRALEATIKSRDGRLGDQLDDQAGQAWQPAAIELSFAEGDADVRISGRRIDFGAVDADFDGTVSVSPDPAGRHRFELGTTTLTSTIGRAGGPAASGTMRIAGQIGFDSGTVEIDRLSLETNGGSLAGTGELTGLERNDRARLHLVATALKPGDVKAFWPFFIADKARDWVLDNVADTGSVSTGSLGVDISLARLAEIIVPGEGPVGDEVRLALNFSDVAFATVGEMPRITAADGELRYRDGTTLVAVTNGRLADLPGLEVAPSSMDFARADDGVSASLSLNLAGDASALLELVDREPVDALRKLGWRAEDVAGSAKVGVGAVLSLGQSEADESRLVNWSVFADLDSVDLKRAIRGRRIQDVSGMLSIAPGAAIGDVTAKIDGVAAKVAFSEPIAPRPIGEATLDITAALTVEEVRAALPSLGDIVDGPVSARLTRIGERLRATLDLGAARLVLPAIGWSKGPGVPTRLTFDLGLSGDGILIRDAELSGEGFSAKGSAEVDRSGLKSVTLDNASLNRGDQISGRIERGSEGYRIEITGDSLDARAIIDQLRREDLPTSPEPSLGRKRFDLTVAVDRLMGFGGEELQDATIRYAGPDTTSLKARTPAGVPVTVTVRPQGKDRTISLLTGDAGALLRFGGLYGRMQGGAGRLQLSGTASGGFSGALTLQDFTLVDEPRLANLVGTTRAGNESLAGVLGRELEVSRAYFDSASVRLDWDGRQLTAREGIVRGPIFGSSFEGIIYNARKQIDISGSFMPAYAINRLFGALPFVGGILGNGAEGALIGITYRLAGAFGDPTLTVNPISAIAPGIFRRIFEY